MIKSRINRLVRAMRGRGINQILVTSDLNIFYFTGTYVSTMERLHVLLVKEDGSCTYFINEIFPVSSEPGAELISFKDAESGQVLKKLSDCLLPGGVTAIDNGWEAVHLLRLMDIQRRVRFAASGDLIEGLMVCKDQAEQDLMRISSEINDKTVEALIQSIDGNTTELSLSRRIHQLYCEFGADGYNGGALTAYGSNCALPHPESGSAVPAKGDSILIDAGASYEFYNSDMSRTVFYQDVNTKLEHVYCTVLKANLEGIAAVKPGVLASEVDGVCRRIIDEAGYGRYFTHRTGHGIGLQLHEYPNISADSKTVLESGMIFSIEPGIYLPGIGGVRIEDLVLVTEDSVEILNKLPKELRIIG